LQTPLFVGNGDVLELGVTAMWIEPVEFGVAGDVLRGDLYRPEGAACPPVVVMAHGFGAERRFRLPAFAERSYRFTGWQPVPATTDAPTKHPG
jgi:hypothetical protein